MRYVHFAISSNLAEYVTCILNKSAQGYVCLRAHEQHERIELILREKERDLTQSCDKTPYTHRTIQKATRQHKNATKKNFDYTTIADRLRTVSRSNSSHPTGVVEPGLRALNLPTHRKSSVINRTWHDRTIVYNTNILCVISVYPATNIQCPTIL